jgi:hypothetical protein
VIGNETASSADDVSSRASDDAVRGAWARGTFDWVRGKSSKQLFILIEYRADMSGHTEALLAAAAGLITEPSSETRILQ